MAYSKLLSSSTPGLIMIMLDQSISMTDGYGGKTKAEVAAMAVNRVINELVEACQSGEEIKNRCYVAVLGYGNEIAPIVGGMISQVADNPANIIDVMRKVPDGAGGLVEIRDHMPIWVTPEAIGSTPMAEAMESVYGLIEGWIGDNPDSFPPIVINITDGVPNDMQIGRRDGAQTRAAAQKLMSLNTTDGHLLLFNAHISNASAGEVKLPNNEYGLYDNYAKFLFHISSVLPDRLLGEAQKAGFSPPSNARGFVFNAGVETMIKLLTFGSTGALR